MKSDIFQVFANVNGGSFISLDTSTSPVLTGGKKNPMQGRITKIMQGASVMVFQNKKSNAYENMVKRRLEQEGKEPMNFELSPRTWGHRIPDTPVIEHEKDGVVKHYLEVIFLKPGNVKYLLDGKKINKADIEGLKEVETGGQGGLDNKVIIRVFGVDSITEIRIDGQAFN